MVEDVSFLNDVLAVVDQPGADLAVIYLAEVAPGILAVIESDREVVLYVNLNTYEHHPDWNLSVGNLRERNVLPPNIGAVQAVTIFNIPNMILYANAMVVKKSGGRPDWYETSRVVRDQRGGRRTPFRSGIYISK